MNRKVLAVDPGEKKIGIAISDETGTLARGLAVIKHISLKADCAEINRLASENEVTLVIVGEAMGIDEGDSPQSRHARKIANALSELSRLPVKLWDETGSTREARAIRLNAGAHRKKRGGHLDEVAAAVILQSWLDSYNEKEKRHA